MNRIKDIEEKILQVAYNLSALNRINKNNFSKLTIYREWLKNWREDFAANGGLIPDFHLKQFVVSAKDPSAPQPEYIKHYNEVLDDCFDWISANYDTSISYQKNCDIISQQLTALRKSHFAELKNLLKSNDKNHEYYISDRTNYAKPNCFGKYQLYSLSDGEINIALKGTFEHTCNYIDELFV